VVPAPLAQLGSITRQGHGSGWFSQGEDFNPRAGDFAVTLVRGLTDVFRVRPEWHGIKRAFIKNEEDAEYSGQDQSRRSIVGAEEVQGDAARLKLLISQGIQQRNSA
jgi:hypothetical protein